MSTNGSIEIVHTSTQGYGFGKTATELKRYQTFVTPANCTRLGSIDLKLRRVEGPTYACIALHAVVDGKPALYDLYSVRVDPQTSTFEVVTANVDWPVEPSTTYALVLSAVPEMVRVGSGDTTRFEWAVAPVYGHLGFGKWNGNAWVDESKLCNASTGGCNGWLRIEAINGDNAVDLTHAGTAGFTFGQTQDQIRRFQTFLAGDTQPVLGIDLKLRKLAGTGHSDVVVELFDTQNHTPTGSALASACIPAGSVGTTWTVVNAPLHHTSTTLEHEYAVVLSQRTPGAAVYEWATGKNNLAVAFGKWTGSAWVQESSLGNGWLKVWRMPDGMLYTIDLIHNNLSGNGFGNVTDEVSRYQNFEVPPAINAADPVRRIMGVDLKLRKFNGTHQSDVTVELYASINSHPKGAPLTSATLPACQVGADWSIVHVPLPPVALKGGKYILVLSQRTLSADRYEWASSQVKGSVTNRFGKWTGTEWNTEAGLGHGWMRLWATIPATGIDIVHAASNGFGFGNKTGEVRRYQTFATPPDEGLCGYTLSGVQVKIRKFSGTDQTDVIVELFETANNKPTGLPMATAVVPSGSAGTDWTTVTAPLYFRQSNSVKGIEAGKTYAIVLGQRQPRAARYEWAASKVNDSLAFGKSYGTAWKDESGLGDGWLQVALIPAYAPT